MKLIHLSDLHIGKKINEFSMTDDQDYILKQISDICISEKADGVMISGDIYDKSVPPSEGVGVFGTFLSRLTSHNIKVFIISGNHDSAERLSFACDILTSGGVYIAPPYSGSVSSVCADGDTVIYMLPFIKPAAVRQYFTDSSIGSYNDAVSAVLSNIRIDSSKCNILMAHQFVVPSLDSDADAANVGGVEYVDSALFDKFDYTALGHLHKSGRVGKECVRYCGTPLRYSFSDTTDKSVTVLETSPGRVEISEIPLHPLRTMRTIHASYDDITLRDNYIGTNTDDYIAFCLTDDEEIPDVMSRLRTIYPNAMTVEYDNKRTREYTDVSAANPDDDKSDAELFSQLFELQNNCAMNDEQIKIINQITQNILNGVD